MHLIPLADPRCGRQSDAARRLMHLFRRDAAFCRSLGIRWRQIPRTPAQTLTGADQWRRKHDARFWMVECDGKAMGTAWIKRSGIRRCDLSRQGERHRRRILALVAAIAP